MDTLFRKLQWIGLPATGEGRLLSNTGWLLAGEGAARGSRLVTVLVMAACLPVSDYGIAMLALATHELIRTLTRLGAGGRIVQCEEERLAQISANVQSLNWLIAALIASAQYAAAPALARFYDMPSLEGILQLMAIAYLLFPVVAVPASVLQRRQQMRQYSACNASAVITENLGTAALLMAGAGLWSIALAKIAGALVWVFAIRRLGVARVRSRFDIAVQRELVHFSSRVMVADLLRAMRGQIDVLLAGRMLSPELFGFYSFAKSAGIGLSNALGNAYAAAIYPRLAQGLRQNRLPQVARRCLQLGVCLSMLFVLQSAAAPIYLELLFAEQWHSAGGLVALLCLVGVPAMVLDCDCLARRVSLQLGQEIVLQLVATASIALAIILLMPADPMAFAQVVVFASLCWVIPGRFGFGKRGE